MKKSFGTKLQKKKVSRGTAKMAAEADKALEEHGKEITKALRESAEKGNATCARLLLALADGLIDCEDEAVVESLWTYAQQLAAEPPWEGPPAEPDED
jgi:hypothetical protein